MNQRNYDEAFRRDAVEVLIKSGRKMSQVARDLGVSEASLRVWKKLYYADASPAGQVRLKRTARELEEELQRLRVSNEQLLQERDILKKAMGILSAPPKSGMP